SGGYWIATEANRVFAEPTTITGSIGVFGMQLNVQKFANDLGVTWDGVKTGEFAGAVSLTRPKTEAELAIFQRLVDWTYGEVVQRVASPRGLTTDQVHAIAQGRVWSGVQARDVGLVDELGGLQPAIDHAAGLAGLNVGEAVVAEFPGARSLGDVLAEMFSDARPRQIRAGPVGRAFAQLTDGLAVLEQFNDPRGVYARLPLEIS